MIDHVLGRPSTKSRRLQVLAVLAFWSAYLLKGHKHGPPLARFFSKMAFTRMTPWQTVVMTMTLLYATRNFSTLVGLASPEPLSNMYSATYFRATWVLTALDAGFWTAMKIRQKWLRDIASLVFSVFYLFAAEKADEKVRKVRGNLTVEHLRVSWNKGTTPYLSFCQKLMRPRYSRWPPRAIRIPRPSTSDYKDTVSAWLYFDGPLAELEHHNKVVLDLPGGGFVAMDPRCNDDKLLSWASKTGLPILSLDYKKAPEYPYPYALNECYDVYATLIKSRGRCIGMSGKETPRIVVTGDSAGGNLATSMTLMIVEGALFPSKHFQGQGGLPTPEAVILFYPGLDMNIGNWMSDEQMALIKDRRMRATNKAIVRRKSMQYNTLVGTPHRSDDEDEPPKLHVNLPKKNKNENSSAFTASPEGAITPQPEYAHALSTDWNKTHAAAAAAAAAGSSSSSKPTSSAVVSKQQQTSGRTSYHSEPMRTRLAMSSMISYFNDRVLNPEMMRAMIILYIGPHNRPDFSQDYLLSPILAPDMLLARFPKTYFLTGERDPLVDDTVVFAGRLRRVKAAMYASGGQRTDYRESDALADGFDDKAIAEVVLLPGTSHGFLQFPTIYPPAWKLIDRSARWIEESFATSERAERDRKQRLMKRAAERPERHHVRTDSSGDEGLLEIGMGMTKAKDKAAADGVAKQGKPEEAGSAQDVNGDEADVEDQELDRKGKRRANGRPKMKTKESFDKSLARLASSDDLLGRRMQGLAGGLTGLAEED
ncbi:alpha/beta-hydrolase [Cryphonectria parasitica EP155]|uniref:Alpha/beta-hydrolase n=1 Tax=Cryphonectria parasitica (strain ATCC 38755 / EP155) TaxID=660469 RepID=A0A9P4Y3V7_CRYP1|nr:alpha/beta-hydrolase [Cryphonectria parasitica EP155]KAF3766043.1 alpha/beta-hydrolase [Cryphonectria parasitica EP155]